MIRRSALLLALAAGGCAAGATPEGEIARWEARARNVTITRDDWGIPHIRGKTDADAVFGMIYGQAEDDFNRVETNYLNAMGRLAEAEGEAEIWRDLRMKLFIHPDTLKAQYAASPEWLRALMDAWADGLNFYLAEHPDVKPRVITRFEPWMALSFTEGSIGGDTESISRADLEAFYGAQGPGPEDGRQANAQAGQPRARRERAAIRAALVAEESAPREPSGSNGFAIAPENTLRG